MAVGLNVALAEVVQLLAGVELDMTVVVALALITVAVMVVVQDHIVFVVVTLSATTVEGARSATRVAAMSVGRMVNEGVLVDMLILWCMRKSIWR